VKTAVFPLLRKDGQPEKAHAVYDLLRPHFAVDYDQAGAIGRRYRRQDEIGTPFGITDRPPEHAGRHRSRCATATDGTGPPADRPPDRRARAATRGPVDALMAESMRLCSAFGVQRSAFIVGEPVRRRVPNRREVIDHGRTIQS
jgi:hypothetical protein